MTPAELWHQLPLYYLTTILIETPVLLFGLSARHSWQVRVFSGFWLTACTYPVVFLVLPMLIDVVENRLLYIAIAETFAPLAECALFWTAFGQCDLVGSRSMRRDFGVIVLANLASFLPFEVIAYLQSVGG